MSTIDQATIDAIKNGQANFEVGVSDQLLIPTEAFSNNPNFLGKLFKRNNKAIPLLTKMRTFFPGRLSTSESSSPIIGHSEEITLRNTFKVSSITAVSGNKATIVIDNADVYTYRPDGAPADVTKTRPRVKDTIYAVAGGDAYVVTAKSADQKTITIESFSGSAPASEILSGQVVRVGAPINSEGSNQIAPLFKHWGRYQNRFWISPETSIVSGSNLTSRGMFEILPDGRIYSQAIEDMDIRSAAAKSDVWLFGKQVESTISQYSEPLSENMYLHGTQGLLDYTKMIGEEIEYDPVVGWALEDFYDITNIYHDMGSNVSTVMGLFGSSLNRKIEEGLRSKLNYSWVMGVSDQFVPANAKSYWGNSESEIQGAFLNLGINGFDLDGITFLKTAVGEFNDVHNAGALGYKDWGIIVPMSYTKIKYGSKESSIPTMGYQYRGADGYSRENEMWVITGAGNKSILTGTKFTELNKSSEWDAAQFHMRWEIAPEFSGGDQFALIKPVQGSK